MKGIGRKIQKCRENAGFTQEQLAEKVDISTSYVSAIEREAKVPTLEIFVKILKCVEAEPNDILAEVVPIQTKEKCSSLEERMKALPVKKQKMVLRILEVIIEEAEK
ncbi:helix-turn-helix domain-containing protein [Clostridium sp. C105KSO13]|uniref:helix-turn-helix domain-containing protein n=1 Tax=Clostridium sp. C105KSO13 TaxID=1776045 RepID=UPI0007407936|nr:helix-turn-helix transcriptional regulator [Clostridium sp. C105KSO13]CUX15551.1 antitoxin HipB [Clostridium sp. C105KSO13]